VIEAISTVLPRWGTRAAREVGIDEDAITQVREAARALRGALEQIDAVFVTVEPAGGSRKPSGKPLLFAYLKVDPNHP